MRISRASIQLRRRFLQGAFLLVSFCVAAILFLSPSSAQARTDATDGNRVNPQQMPDSSFLYDTSIYDLLNADTSLNGSTVQVTGEVVGDAVSDTQDPGKVWITLASTDRSKEGSISVLIAQDDVDLIDTFGRYGAKGTTLRVKGMFHLSSPTYQGITDIQADTVSVVSSGLDVAVPFNQMKFVPGFIMVGIGLALTGLYYLLRARQR